MDAPIWDVTVFTNNRDRLQEGDMAAKVMAAVLGQSRVKALLSQDHFSVDGTLIEACPAIPMTATPCQGRSSRLNG